MERIDSLHEATQRAFPDILDVPILTCGSGTMPEKLLGTYLAEVESDFGSGDLQERQLELQKTRQLDPRSKSFDSPFTGISWDPYLPDDTHKDPLDRHIRNSPDLTMVVSRQGMMNLRSSISGSDTEGPLNVNCSEDCCKTPVVMPVDSAAQPLPTSTAPQAPSRPIDLSCSSRDSQENLFVLPSQTMSIIIKNPSDGSVQTPRRPKFSSKPPSLAHSRCTPSKIQEPIFIRPGPIQPITIKEPVSGNVIDLPHLQISGKTSSWGRLCSDRCGPYQNLFAIPSSATPIIIKDPSGRKIETYVKR